MQAIPYNAQADPRQYISMMVNNLVGEILGAQERQKQANELQSISRWAAGGFQGPMPEVRTDVGQAMASRLTNALYQPLSPYQQMAGEKLRRYKQIQQTQGQVEADKWLNRPLVNVNMPTGQQLLTEQQRQQIAEADYAQKVGLSSSEMTNARKSVEDIFNITPIGANRWLGWHAGIKDYEKSTVVDMYKQWRAEQGYENKTPDQQKALDDIWDQKIAAMNKSGFVFKDKDRGRLSKDEIWWDPADEEIIDLRQTVVAEPPATNMNIDERKALPNPKTKQEYENLPSGTRFIDPEGKIRIKP